MFGYIHKSKIEKALTLARKNEAKKVKEEYSEKISNIINEHKEQITILEAGYQSQVSTLKNDIKKLREEIKSNQDAYRNYRDKIAMTHLLADQLEEMSQGVGKDVNNIYQSIVHAQKLLKNIIRVFKKGDKKNSEKLNVIEYSLNEN